MLKSQSATLWIHAAVSEKPELMDDGWTDGHLRSADKVKQS